MTSSWGLLLLLLLQTWLLLFLLLLLLLLLSENLRLKQHLSGLTRAKSSVVMETGYVFVPFLRGFYGVHGCWFKVLGFGVSLKMGIGPFVHSLPVENHVFIKSTGAKLLKECSSCIFILHTHLFQVLKIESFGKLQIV